MANISKIKVGNTSYGITATPTAHASTATTYGAASASNYGHVKLSDNYTSSAGAAASGIGASSLAVYNAYNTLNSNLDTLGGRLSFVSFPDAHRDTFEITGVIIGTEGLYLMIIQESMGPTIRANPSYAFIYVNYGYAWITLQKGEGSAINDLTFNSGIITVNLSEKRYLFASALKLL